MNERIRIQFLRDGVRLPVSHLDQTSGLVLAFESSARPLGFGLELGPANEIVRQALDRVRQIEDWPDNNPRVVFRSDDDGALIISGNGKRQPEHSLPAGQYEFRFVLSETRFRDVMRTVDIPQNGDAQVQLNLVSPGLRFVLTDTAQWDDETLAVCQHQDSRIDSMDPLSWLRQPQPRLARKACLLNLLAKARSLPVARPGESLCPHIESIHWADVDRIDVKAGPGLLPKLQSLPEWHDSQPLHPAHAQTISSIFGGSPGDYTLQSFREPVDERSMQVVVATKRATGQQYAEFDIDLGNPGMDLTGLIIHVGELLDPGRTNHLALYQHLLGGATSDFMHYSLEQAAGQVVS